MVELEFKEDEDYIVFNGKYMESYIPSIYFEQGLATMIGDHFKTIGIFNFRTFKDEDGKTPNKLATLNVPTEIFTYPTGGFEERTLQLGNTEEKYMVAKYYNTDRFINRKVAASVRTFVLFVNMLTQGKIPGTIPYDRIIDVFDKAMIANNIDFDMPDLTKELIVSQIYRDKSDMNRTFAQGLKKNPNLKMKDYVAANPRELSMLQSNFSGLIFEDMETMLVSSINNTNAGREENISPLEEVMKY